MKTKQITKDATFYTMFAIMGSVIGLSLCPSVISYIRSI